jgi:GNAT superfamily N-acetyltransferase
VALEAPRQLEPLQEHHDVGEFSCGVPTLDAWLHRSAATAAAKHVGRTYVWVSPSDPTVVHGYITLAPHVVRRIEAPGRISRGSPETIPAILLARLALSRDQHGKGHGADLLVDALHRASDAIAIAGGRLIVVDAIDDEAAAFYEHYGFVRLAESLRLFRKATDIARDLGRDPATLAARDAD